MKKLLIISFVLLLLTVVFLLVYNFVFKIDATVVEQEAVDVTSELPAPVPEATEKKISLITNVDTMSAALAGEEIVYFDNTTDSFMQMSPRGTSKTELFDPGLSISDVSWSPNGRHALMSIEGGGVLAFYDGATKILPTTADYATWSQDEENIIYKSYDQVTNERTLRILDLKKNEDQFLADLPFRNVLFAQIPQSFLVAYWQLPDSFTASTLRSVGTINTADPRTVYDGLFGADYLFSPDGQRILASYTVESGGNAVNLGVMNKSGGEFTGLNIPTLVSKAVWSRDNQTVYYAQPLAIPDEAVMPNDYIQGTLTTQDTFWKVDITTGERSRLIELKDLPEEIDASNLFLYPDESILFFINRTNGKLYRINL